MPVALAPLPLGVPITAKDGTPTEFYRLRWEELRTGVREVSASAEPLSLINQHAAVPLTTVATPGVGGIFRFGYYLRKTFADGVSSSVAVTFTWTDGGVVLSETLAALTLDTTLAQQSGVKIVRADALTTLSVSASYASNTPARMGYDLIVFAEAVS